MKTFVKILLILSLTLNIYFAYTLVVQSTDIDFLEMELKDLDQQTKNSLTIFKKTLIGKTKEEIMQMIPTIKNNDFQTVNNTETLSITSFKFEFIDNKLQYISISPR